MQSALYNSAKLFFDILDSQRKKLCNVYNRDNIALPILFLPQVLLLAFGEEDKNKLGFAYHKQKVEIL